MTEAEGSVLQDAADIHYKTQIEQTRQRRDTSRTQGTYDVYIEIDCDCEELLDAIGFDYKEVEDDETQNEVALHLDDDEYGELVHDVNFAYTDEQDIALFLLNAELSEYVTKVTIYKPSGDKITFE